MAHRRPAPPPPSLPRRPAPAPPPRLPQLPPQAVRPQAVRPQAVRPQAVGPQAVPPQAGQLKNNGSTAHFQNFTQNNAVVDPNFNNVEAFKRAIKVFIVSYPEISAHSPPFQRRKFEEYIAEMRHLYNTPNITLMSFMSQLYAEVKTEKLAVLVTCKKIVGRDKLKNPKLVSNYQGQQLKRILDVSKDQQPYAPLKMNVKYDMFEDLRSDPNRELVLTIEEDQSGRRGSADEPLRPFHFIFAKTHPEGFEDWVEFGRDVELLINVEYKVKKETNIDQKDVSKHHLHTIELMIRKRLFAYQVDPRPKDLGHQQTAFQSKVTYRRPFAQPESDGFFWSRPDLRTPFSKPATYPRKVRKGVKFTDIQVAFETTDDFQDKVCLCTEWCNWNAFFHHNPIYRFYLVRHRQLYLKNISNLPEMYLCLPVLYGCVASPTFRTPVVHLINCANEYRKKYYDKYYLKSLKKSVFQNQYNSELPSPYEMNALAYNKLRDQFNVVNLCLQLYVYPFGDNFIEDLLNYNRVLTDLHQFHSRNRNFVTDKYKWSRDMDSLTRIKYKDYILESFAKCIADPVGGYDHMFTLDFEYASRLYKTNDEFEIKKKRDRLFKKLTADSPFNLNVHLNDFLNSFVLICKFLAKIEPTLPSFTGSKAAATEVFRTYQLLDIDLQRLSISPKTLTFTLDANSSGFPYLERHFHRIYTLKLYFYTFEVQKHFINSGININKKSMYRKEQVSPSFIFIWDHSVIEQKVRTSYQGETLYQIRPINHLINGFYENFWGKARHELPGLQNYDQYLESAHFEYQRLYFWWKNDGNNRRIFAKINELQNAILDNITNRSERIFLDDIIPSIIELQSNTYPYFNETFDHLVYYLAKAHCSLILSSLAMFFRPMHNLQDDPLCSAGMSFSMTKPGWVPFFRTMTKFMDVVDEVQDSCMAFDDEFGRIVNTCLQTKQMIKEIYRQFYAKLSTEWVYEIYTCFDRIIAPYPIGAEFLILHLAVGLSFASHFFNSFRKEFNKCRKKCLKKLETRSNPQLPHQGQFTGCLPIVTNYLSERNLINQAMPFQSNIWRLALSGVFARFDQSSGQQLAIDLNAANI